MFKIFLRLYFCLSLQYAHAILFYYLLMYLSTYLSSNPLYPIIFPSIFVKPLLCSH
jgi:hypothetical protein